MKETVLEIALAAIATGIFKLLLPDSSFKKQIAFLTACFFLLSCISFVRNSTWDFSQISASLRQEGAYVDYSLEAYRLMQNEIAQALAEDINDLLTENEIPVQEIRVIVDISSAYSISIKQVRLAFSLKDADCAAFAEELVKKEVGDEIEVIVEIRGY